MRQSLQILSSDLSFHEASIEKIRSSDNSIELFCSDVVFRNKKICATIIFENISKVIRNDQCIEKIDMEQADAEIYSLLYNEDSFYLIVEWVNFKNSHSYVASYEINSNLTVLGEDGDQIFKRNL